MTVIVKYENGMPLYRSIDGPGASEKDRLKAQQLDQLIKKELKKLSNRISSINRKNVVEIYWEFGNVLRRIFLNSGFVKKEEKIYFEENVKIHTPKELLAKDRGPNRRHIDYCFRLASYEKKKVMKMKWGEWTELFDRNQENRFDEWFDLKTAVESGLLKREFIRRFTKIKTAILHNLETKDFDKNELYRCYETSWLLAKELYNSKVKVNDKKYLMQILIKIKSDKNNIGKLISGSTNPDNYKNYILKTL